MAIHRVGPSGEIELLAEVNMQADWAQDNPALASFIKNKPNLGSSGGSGVQSDWLQLDESDLSYIKNIPDFFKNLGSGIRTG
jgi:hypothetical protein